MTTFEISEIKGAAKMLEQLHLLQQLTKELTHESSETMLGEMIEKGYRMIGIFENQQCVGISGIWIGTKLYSGKYLEIDNFVIDKNTRSKGAGKILVNYIEQIAIENKCKCIMLDAYTSNNAAHKFYLREGFLIRGFHFIKEM
ncbi:MAG TPA: GNAT family N-acetyltransferase [Flavobacteriales bacterium]|nr:GNAT family N-acetyltransferase [Flavobacteriales bacterium]HRE96904.1 GNAT family N-acetyltransferase [Flavobacteriales bacterium]HRJ39947.1 GNAT family N-acetyltransferase [Flavobacteriales bacterium]